MNFIKNNAGVIAVIALVIAIIGVYTPVGQSVSNFLGGVTNYDEVDVTALKVGGTNGTRVGPIIVGTCSLVVTPSITASTTKAVDCAVTGVVSGDYVFAGNATTSANQVNGSGSFFISGANASTTSGFITLQITNFTGQNATVPREIASSTPYQVYHPVTSVPGL